VTVHLPMDRRPAEGRRGRPRGGGAPFCPSSTRLRVLLFAVFGLFRAAGGQFRYCDVTSSVGEGRHRSRTLYQWMSWAPGPGPGDQRARGPLRGPAPAQRLVAAQPPRGARGAGALSPAGGPLTGVLLPGPHTCASRRCEAPFMAHVIAPWARSGSSSCTASRQAHPLEGGAEWAAVAAASRRR